MKPNLILDSTPLALIVHRRGLKQADDCRLWVERHITDGVRVLVPEIVHYEVRRELLRLSKTAALGTLDIFSYALPDRFLPLNSSSLRLAAELWAIARQQGVPTADPHALDVDVILAAQILSHGLAPADFIVATGNVGHLSRFVPAEEWSKI